MIFSLSWLPLWWLYMIYTWLWYWRFIFIKNLCYFWVQGIKILHTTKDNSLLFPSMFFNVQWPLLLYVDTQADTLAHTHTHREMFHISKYHSGGGRAMNEGRINECCQALFSRLSDVILTHVELGDVKVRLDRTQFPCFIFQKHPQLFQPCPKGLRKKDKEWGWSTKGQEEQLKS